MSVEYHVISTEKGGWRVMRRGADRASSVHATQTEAVGRARQLVEKESGGYVIVHGVDGTIKSARDYKFDPKPQRESKIHSRVKA